MDTPSRSTRDLARQLVAVEAAAKSPADPPSHEVMRVFAKLQAAVTRFAGVEGFTSLLQRALVLARVEIPSLQVVKLNPDGSLDGLLAVAADASSGGLDAAVTLIAHLLWLLVTFIGEPLLLRLVQEAWPHESLGRNNNRGKLNE